MARHLDSHSAKVSRIEHGRQLATAADVRAWAAACGANSQVIDELLGIVQAATSIHLSWAPRMRHGQVAVQRSYRHLIERASLYQSMQQLLIPGLLQTADYARAVLADSRQHHGLDLDDVDEAVQARLAHQRVLHEAGHDFEFLIGGAALRLQVANPGVMAGQLDRLHTVLGLSNVRFGIIPLHRRLAVVPQPSVDIIDGRVVLIERATGELQHQEADEVAKHQATFARAWADAVEDDSARAIIIDAAKRHRAAAG